MQSAELNHNQLSILKANLYFFSSPHKIKILSVLYHTYSNVGDGIS